jgi:hypothetical protein
MSTALAIRDRVQELLSGGIDLDSFEDWFLSHTWNSHLREDARTVAAIRHIEGTLLDFSSEAIGLETLHKELASAIRPLAPRGIHLADMTSQALPHFLISASVSRRVDPQVAATPSVSFNFRTQQKVVGA